MTADYFHNWAYWTRHARLWTESIKWFIYVGVGWGMVYLRRWQKSRLEESAQGWPSVEGSIADGKVKRISHTSRFLATLEYTYFVEEYRNGKYTHEFPKKADAEDFVEKLKGQRVQIRYKQSNPSKSVLEQSVVEQHILLAPTSAEPASPVPAQR